MKTIREIKLTLTLRGPILTKSTAPSTFGLDAAVARDFLTDQPCLPGTLIKGKVREALEQIGETSGLERLFGQASDEANGATREPGRLIVGDFVASTEADRGATIQRVKLNHLLGSAEGQMLRVIETPYLAGQKVCFSGMAYFYADEDEAKQIAGKLRLGLRWLAQVGSLRTTSFGRLMDADTELQPASTANVASLSAAPASLEVALRPQGPLCISRHKICDNLFVSDDIIPGNMLAGAIMDVAKALGIDGRLGEFHKIRFRHAFPTTTATRPLTLALSTVKAGKIPYDIATFRNPVLLQDESGRFGAPAFPIDWKEYGAVLGTLGWAAPARELRVRTAIDSEKRTADRGDGQGGKLFALEVVHPVIDDRKTPIVWRSQIDLQKVSNPAATAKALAQVLSQLGYVSKTKARCHADVTEVLQPASAPALTNAQSLALVLQTPTLLADPRFQSVTGVKACGALSAREMLDLYRGVWAQLSDHSLELAYHFAEQYLAGGEYLARRFQKGKAYDPWLLTREGSVFVFTVKDAIKAIDHIGKWLATGLPLPDWASRRYGDGWQENPYRPENGFGEIAIHRPIFAAPVTQRINLAEPVLS